MIALAWTFLALLALAGFAGLSYLCIGADTVWHGIGRASMIYAAVFGFIWSVVVVVQA